MRFRPLPKEWPSLPAGEARPALPKNRAARLVLISKVSTKSRRLSLAGKPQQTAAWRPVKLRVWLTRQFTHPHHQNDHQPLERQSENWPRLPKITKSDIRNRYLKAFFSVCITAPLLPARDKQAKPLKLGTSYLWLANNPPRTHEFKASVQLMAECLQGIPEVWVT